VSCPATLRIFLLNGQQEVIDPELAAASVLLERPDIRDHLQARASLAASPRDATSALEDTLGRVTFEDCQIPTSDPTETMTVRIYSPVGVRTLSPAVVFFHGGAFVMGDLESEHPRCLRYAANAGCVVVSVDYRLAPEHPFPAPLEDCYSALLWVHDHAAELGIDTDRIAVAGASAGGALAAATTLLSRDRGGPTIELQILIYPVIDNRKNSPSVAQFHDTPVWDSVNNEAMWDQYGGGEVPQSKYAAPGLEENLAGLPTACIVTAGYDPLRDEAIEYASRLLHNGVPVELHQVAGAYHGFDSVVPDAEISRRSVDEQVYWLKHFLRA
jgi:acetyl esterase